MKPGDDVMVLPSGFTSRIASIETADGPLEQASPLQSVIVTLEAEIDISRRHDLLDGREVRNPVWWDVRHQAPHRWARGKVTDLQYRLNINTLHREEEATHLDLNDIRRARFRTTIPFFVDECRRNRHTGSFIFVDEGTNPLDVRFGVSGVGAGDCTLRVSSGCCPEST